MIIVTKKKMEYPDIINGVSKKRILEIGKHIVDSASLDHWFVKGNILSGDIVVVGEKEPPPRRNQKVVVPENASAVVQRILVRGVQPIHPAPPENVQEIMPKEKPTTAEKKRRVIK